MIYLTHKSQTKAGALLQADNRWRGLTTVKLGDNGEWEYFTDPSISPQHRSLYVLGVNEEETREDLNEAFKENQARHILRVNTQKEIETGFESKITPAMEMAVLAEEDLRDKILELIFEI